MRALRKLVASESAELGSPGGKLTTRFSTCPSSATSTTSARSGSSRTNSMCLSRVFDLTASTTPAARVSPESSPEASVSTASTAFDVPPAAPSLTQQLSMKAPQHKPCRSASPHLKATPIHRSGGRMRPSRRQSDELRAVSLDRGVVKYAEGSCFVKFGDTHVLVTATLEDRLPPWLKGQARGWVTAEYGMLPRATIERTRREASVGKQNGRTVEIQRLIGRSLRAVINLEALGARPIPVH